MSSLKRKALTLTIAATLVSVAGCGTMQENFKQADIVQAQSRSASSDALNSIRAKDRVSLVNSNDGFYVNQSPTLMVDKKLSLPPIFKRQVTVSRKAALNISDIAEIISRDIGVPTAITPDLANNIAESGISGSPLDLGNGLNMDTGGFAEVASIPEAAKVQDSTSAAPVTPRTKERGSSADEPTVAGTGVMNLRFTGSLEDMLELVSTRLNVFWRYEDGQIIFYQYDTKSFVIAVIPGKTETKASVSNDSSGAGEASSTGETVSTSSQASAQSTSITGTVGVWAEIKDVVKVMLSTNGEMAISETAGLITITDNPMVMKRVSAYIDQINAIMTRQVVVSVKVYNIAKKKGSVIGVNWDAVYSALDGRYSLGFTSATPSDLATGSSELTATILSPTSAWKNTSAILNALSTQGEVSLVTSASVMTLNNQPVPVQVANQTTYLASSSIVDSGSGLGGTSATGTELTPGTVTTGFGMNILPRIIDSQQMLLQYAIDISSLESLDDITSGEQRIQAPRVSTRNFMQRVALQSGDSLVLTGFESVSNDTYNQQSMLITNNKKAEASRNMTVIVMTPILTQGIK